MQHIQYASLLPCLLLAACGYVYVPLPEPPPRQAIPRAPAATTQPDAPMPEESATARAKIQAWRGHGYRFEGLTARVDVQYWSFTAGEWEYEHTWELSVSGETCGDDPFGVWGIDLIHTLSSPKYGMHRPIRAVGSDQGRKRSWYLGMSPDGQFKDPYERIRFGVGGGVASRGKLRLLPQSPPEVEMTLVLSGGTYRVVRTIPEVDDLRVRAPVEEIWDCELDLEEVARPSSAKESLCAAGSKLTIKRHWRLLAPGGYQLYFSKVFRKIIVFGKANIRMSSQTSI
jgi:hypothetical protein